MGEQPRITTAIIDYLGAEDTPLVREQTKLWFVAAVARVFSPGCKFDNVTDFARSTRYRKKYILQDYQRKVVQRFFLFRQWR